MKRTWLWAGIALIALAMLYLPSLQFENWSVFAWFLVLLCPLVHLLGFHGGYSHGHGAHGDGRSTVDEGEPSRMLKGGDEA